ncbi:thioredoxin domain-containing protein [Anaerolineae bacterium CFX7]|nr:thioredoxin domain-containing protein [Anaerolineae bacterium CFX7]
MSNQNANTIYKFTNGLAQETSPYLLDHAHNPVDWYAWNSDALEKAKREDKPIFLSIGYAACHWCHVMAHESFEDEATARFMNEHFVNIKVDREERPDLDSIYMNAVVAMTGSGGWPMSVFLTSDGKPFYGGTYFPKTSRYGMPSFMNVLQGIANAWRTRRDDIEHNGAAMQKALREGGVPRGAAEMPLDARTLELALNNLVRAFDRENGGFGGAPKFPQPMALEFLIRAYTKTRDELILKMLTLTLDKMARGGMYDQLGGGFHRYATDDVWLVPHFEKMLYDNAQLARVYLHAYQITNNEFYKRITTEILDYVAREMLDANGGFYSSQDADSEGHEGKFFVWTSEEIRNVLGGSASGLLVVSKTRQDTHDAQLFMDAYGVTANGNFEGKNILHRARDNDVLAAMHKLGELEVERRLNAAKQKLFAARERRVKPARDEKILTGWNGLMLAAFAEAARVFKREDYRAIAIRNAAFVLENLATKVKGEIENHKSEITNQKSQIKNPMRLKRSYKDGQARLNGYLEDYANLAEGLLALYETTFKEKYFVAARELAEQILAHFGDARGGFCDTSNDHEELVVRPKDVQDNATPSGNAMAVMVLAKLAAFTGEARYVDVVEQAIAPLQPALAQAPTGFGWWLCALNFELAPPKEIAIISPVSPGEEIAIISPVSPGEEIAIISPLPSGEGLGVRELLDVVFGEYRPNQVVALKRADADSAIPLLEGRTMIDGKATAYVCQNFACLMPVTEAEALKRQMTA